MSDLLFVRHAETHLAGTFCGHSDPPLNDRGRSQLPGLLDRLATHPIDAVYTSDLHRARETADAIANQHNARCQVTSALREIDFGSWESLTWKAIELRDPVYAVRWVAEFPNLPAPGGETSTAFRQRILDELQRLRHQAATANIAVVTHAGVLRVLLEDVGHLSSHDAWERTRDYTCMIHCTQATPESALVIHP